MPVPVISNTKSESIYNDTCGSTINVPREPSIEQENRVIPVSSKESSLIAGVPLDTLIDHVYSHIPPPALTVNI